jgi:hypothetical protein
MLTVKHVNGTEVIIEAEQVEYHPASGTFGNQSEAFSPAQVIATGGSGHIGGMAVYTTGKVYVMNDKGRTISTYHLDLDNAVAPARAAEPAAA